MPESLPKNNQYHSNKKGKVTTNMLLMTSEQKSAQKRDAKLTALVELVANDQSPFDRSTLLSHSIKLVKQADTRNRDTNRRSKPYSHVVAAACYSQFKSNSLCAKDDFVRACKRLQTKTKIAIRCWEEFENKNKGIPCEAGVP